MDCNTSSLYGIGFIFPLIPIYISAKGLDPYLIGIVASTATLSSIVVVSIMGRISDVVSRERLQGLIGLGLAFLVLMYLAANGFISFIGLHPPYVSLLFSYMTLSGVIAMDYISSSRGIGFGKFRTSGALGWMIGTFLGGIIADSLGFFPAFIFSSVVFLISAVAFGIGKKTVRAKPCKGANI